jgi:hypothetical protein
MGQNTGNETGKLGHSCRHCHLGFCASQLQPATTKLHRLGDLSHRGLFLTVLEVSRLRSKWWVTWLLLRAFPRLADSHLLAVSSYGLSSVQALGQRS